MRLLVGSAHQSHCQSSAHMLYTTAFQFESHNLELSVSRCGAFVTIEWYFHSVLKVTLIQFGISLKMWLACLMHSNCLTIKWQPPLRGLLWKNIPSQLQWLRRPWSLFCSYFTFLRGKSEGRRWGAVRLMERWSSGCAPACLRVGAPLCLSRSDTVLNWQPLKWGACSQGGKWAARKTYYCINYFI